MDKFCEDCVHNSVCQYGAYCPSGHCNDKDTLDDLMPRGEWIKVKEERMSIDMSGEIATRYKCSECGRTITILPSKLADYPFCHCGADMRKG